MALLDISSKFDTEVLTSIIKKAGGDEYTAYRFGEGFKKGDSYLSKVYRLRVYGVNKTDGKNVEVNLIVKSMPDNLARRKVFRSADFFRNEIKFYTKVVPAWEKFQAERNPKRPFKEYPICYAYHCDGENDFIALEDVSYSGYGSPNRQETISLEDCLLTMRTLGRFHGISLAFKALDKTNFENAANELEETYFSEKQRNWYIDFLKIACNIARDAVSKTYPNTKYEALATNFLTADTLFEDMIHLVSSKSPLSAVGHGDCWSPNFLTRYTESGVPEAITIIDFQLARYASIAVDISFFIYSCTSESLREQHYEEILRAYHESACELITDLGADAEKIFSWKSFKDELQNYARFGCGMGIESLPMSMIEEDEVADLDSIQEDNVLADIWNLKPFKEAKKRERIAQMFKHAIDSGYIK